MSVDWTCDSSHLSTPRGEGPPPYGGALAELSYAPTRHLLRGNWLALKSLMGFGCMCDGSQTVLLSLRCMLVDPVLLGLYRVVVYFYVGCFCVEFGFM